MKVKHIGHAGFLVGCGDEYFTSVLACDPWFNPAFLKSWFPWPDNRQYIRQVRQDATHIYISHAHEDHFDREFLKTMPDIPVIIPKFRSRYLEREVKKLGFSKVITLAHGETYMLNSNFIVKMLIDRSHKEDSALLMHDVDKQYSFLDSNDCHLAASDWPQGVDLLAAQYSGAFWHPHCYDYSSEKQIAKAREVVKNNTDRLCQAIKITGTKQYLPSAGPAVFLDPELRGYNFRGIFPQYIDIADEVERQCPEITLHPAMHGGIIHYPDYLHDRRHEWQSWYYEDDTPATSEEIASHFNSLQQANSRFLENYRNDLVIYSGRDDWQVQLGVVEGELEESFDPHYFMNVPPRVLRAVLDGRATWETALLSMRIKLKREPDKYDYKLMGLLGFGDRPAQTRAMWRAQRDTETTELTDSATGVRYQIPRWCAHAGEDLTTASICEGVLECPRHHWKWEADTGRCISGQDLNINSRKLDSDS